MLILPRRVRAIHNLPILDIPPQIPAHRTPHPRATGVVPRQHHRLLPVPKITEPYRRNRVRITLIVVHSIEINRPNNRTLIADPHHHPPLHPCPPKRRQQYPHQKRNDRNHHKQLNKREPSPHLPRTLFPYTLPADRPSLPSRILFGLRLSSYPAATIVLTSPKNVNNIPKTPIQLTRYRAVALQHLLRPTICSPRRLHRGPRRLIPPRIPRLDPEPPEHIGQSHRWGRVRIGQYPPAVEVVVVH